MKGPQDYLKLGDWNTVCYECGRKRKASELRKHWQGYYVCPEHWEPRHPQDFVRGIPDVQTPPWTQPMPATVFTYTNQYIGMGDGVNKQFQLGDGLYATSVTSAYTTVLFTANLTTFATYSGGGLTYTLNDGLGHNVTTLESFTGAYKTDWQGTNLLYATPRTNIVADSCSMAGASWADQIDYTTVAATALVPGHLAYQWTDIGGGNRSIVQTTTATGNYSGNNEVLSLIIENVNAVYTEVGFAQGGAGNFWVCIGRYLWATDAFTDVGGNGGTFTVTQLGIGPNGGKMVKLSASNSTAGLTAQGRQIFLYLCGVLTNTNTTIPHAAQHEVGSVATPIIVNDTAAPLTVTDYTLSGTQVTLGQNPTIGATLQWSGIGILGNYNSYTTNGYGLITFTIAPNIGAPVYASGSETTP